jgi:hypothetical protein
MKIRLGQSNRAFAVIVVFVLLAVMSVYLVSNAIALGVLKRELVSVEKAQKRQIERLALSKRKIPRE